MKEMTFETALNNLDGIIKDLENGNIPLEDAISKYTDAMNLVKICQEKLDNATEQVNKIIGTDGEVKDFLMKEDETNEQTSNENN
ncbi:exodeoxyribonuclease VII small subunit [bacterium]|uniref:exodeoxyribonuclease VII small subunit n=1 Tax=Candidatus Ventrenecus sp. TaxID=3085654 RepID=UPI001D58CB2D|nr:exodeoxyribonuclease VII small subunit [bacterium]